MLFRSMSAPELTGKAVEAIGSGKYDLIVLNFANPDMVGHTGVYHHLWLRQRDHDAGNQDHGLQH